MKQNIFNKILVVILLSFTFQVVKAQQGGLLLYEVATPNVGNAYAGQSAVTHDASTAYLNPAGITEVKGSNWLIGVEGVFSKIEYNSNINDGSVNAGSPMPSFGAYWVGHLNEKWTFGATLNAPMGTGFDYGDDWEGRYYVQNGTIAVVNFAPTVAYRLSDKLSLGVAVNLYAGMISEEIALQNLSITQTQDGQAKLDGSSFNVGFQFGVHYRPAENTKIGLMYRYMANLNFDGDADVKDYVLNGQVVKSLDFSTKMKIPHGLNLGISQRFGKLEALLDVGFTNWKSFKEQPITLDGIGNDLAFDREWKNTYRVGIGCNYNLTEVLMLRAGYSYDSNPTVEAFRSPDTPVSSANRFAVGGNLKVSEKLNIGLNYAIAVAGKENIKQESVLQGDIDGTYNPVLLNTVALTFGF